MSWACRVHRLKYQVGHRKLLGRMPPSQLTSAQTKFIDDLAGRCRTEIAAGHRHVWTFNAANWVLGLAAAGLTAVVGVTVFYDSLSDVWKAGLAVAAVLANVVATWVRAEKRMTRCRAERAEWQRLLIEVEHLEDKATAADVKALCLWEVDLKKNKALVPAEED